MTTITTSQTSPWTSTITSINLISLHFLGGWPNSCAEVKNLGSFNSIKNSGTFENRCNKFPEMQMELFSQMKIFSQKKSALCPLKTYQSLIYLIAVIL